MKILSQIFFGAAVLCFAAVTPWAGQAQQSIVDEDSLSIIAEAAVINSYDPSANLLYHDRQETPFLISLKQAKKHPTYSGFDLPESSHEDASRPLDGAIDACSLVCLSCHDGIHAPETRVKTVGEWRRSSDFDNRSHPIGADYDKACSGNKALKPRAHLSPEIILPEGKIGCESCHNLHSSRPHFLVFSNPDGALCLECHIK